MQIEEYDRKTFTVRTVQLNLENYQEVAEWCKGTIEMVPTKMMGTETLLPCVKVRGQGDNKNKDSVATLGCYMVELKGSFRVYKPAQFHSAFDKKRPKVYRGTEETTDALADHEAVDTEAARTLDIPEGEELRSTL